LLPFDFGVANGGDGPRVNVLVALGLIENALHSTPTASPWWQISATQLMSALLFMKVKWCLPTICPQYAF